MPISYSDRVGSDDAQGLAARAECDGPPRRRREDLRAREMTHPETNLQSEDLRSTVENLHFHTSRLSLSVASTNSSKSPRHSLAPWVRPLQPGICILRSALSRTRTHLSPPGTVTLLGYDPSSPGSPISDLHSPSTHLTRSLGKTPPAQDLRSPICTLTRTSFVSQRSSGTFRSRGCKAKK